MTHTDGEKVEGAEGKKMRHGGLRLATRWRIVGYSDNGAKNGGLFSFGSFCRFLLGFDFSNGFEPIRRPLRDVCAFIGNQHANIFFR